MNENLIRLGTLIDERQNQVIDQWKRATRMLPGARQLEEPLLVDHIPQLLHELSSALQQGQSLSLLEMRAHESAREHGASRFKLGFDVEEVVAEFGILRDVIQQFAETHDVAIAGDVNRTVNRVIDKAIADSIQTYVQQQAAEVERNRRQYLSFVVHDLKTPIAAMVTAASVMHQKLQSGAHASPAIDKMIGILQRNATRLNDRVMEIINEESRLLALTADAPKLQLHRRDIDLWPIAERLRQDCQSIADAKKNAIQNEVPHDLRVHADPDLLVEVLQNLLSNALKYTSNGEISIGGAEDLTAATCWVRDTGIGIPAERLRKIFQKGQPDPRVSESTGLGLALAKRVMDIHGGSISVQSTQGAGSTFRIEFPKPERRAG